MGPKLGRRNLCDLSIGSDQWLKDCPTTKPNSSSGISRVFIISLLPVFLTISSAITASRGWLKDYIFDLSPRSLFILSSTYILDVFSSIVYVKLWNCRPRRLLHFDGLYNLKFVSFCLIYLFASCLRLGAARGIKLMLWRTPQLMRGNALIPSYD